MSTAAQRWREGLDAWAVPEQIIGAAEENPWLHPPELFAVPEIVSASPSNDRAREALPDRGAVLDVGCGAGRAAFALTPPASHVIGVEHQANMLERFEQNATKRRVTCQVVHGDWPEVAEVTPSADVVTAHHVVYNVNDVVPFLRALQEHAHHRVVLELPHLHPLSSLNAAWQHFWQLERPEGPTSRNLLAVLDEMHIDAHSLDWRAPVRTTLTLDETAHFTRIRLCLPGARESEVYDFLAQHPVPLERALTTVWWDI